MVDPPDGGLSFILVLLLVRCACGEVVVSLADPLLTNLQRLSDSVFAYMILLTDSSDHLNACWTYSRLTDLCSNSYVCNFLFQISCMCSKMASRSPPRSCKGIVIDFLICFYFYFSQFPFLIDQ